MLTEMPPMEKKLPATKTVLGDDCIWQMARMVPPSSVALMKETEPLVARERREEAAGS